MKIGFDAKRAVQNNTGLGNYSRYIVEILSDFYDGNSYFLFAPKNKSNPRLQSLKEKKNVFFLYPSGLWKKFASAWRSFGIKVDLKKENIDIFHGLSNELPIGMRKTAVKSVVSIHDLIFLRYPEYYRPIDRIIYKFKFRYACQKSNRIIAISECTKRDIVSFFNIPPEKIDVVYQGCHSNFRENVPGQKKDEVIKKYSLPSKFILFVGSIEPRKNVLLIAKALKLISQDIHVVAVGKRTPYQSELEQFIDKNGLSQQFHIFNQVPFDDLPALYQLAQIFVYPSFFEGFGIPIIEALSSKTPVIAATGSCLEEAGGPDSLYIDPMNEKELASNITRILADEMLAEKMSMKGREYVEHFSDKNIAKDLINIYSTVLKSTF